MFLFMGGGRILGKETHFDTDICKAGKNLASGWFLWNFPHD